MLQRPHRYRQTGCPRLVKNIYVPLLRHVNRIFLVSLDVSSEFVRAANADLHGSRKIAIAVMYHVQVVCPMSAEGRAILQGHVNTVAVPKAELGQPNDVLWLAGSITAEDSIGRIQGPRHAVTRRCTLPGKNDPWRTGCATGEAAHLSFGGGAAGPHVRAAHGRHLHRGHQQPPVRRLVRGCHALHLDAGQRRSTAHLRRRHRRRLQLAWEASSPSGTHRCCPKASCTHKG